MGRSGGTPGGRAHASRVERARRSVARRALTAGGAVLAAVAILLLANLALYLVLFGPADGASRIAFEIRAVLAGRAMETGAATPEQAFTRLHRIAPAAFRGYVQSRVDRDEPFAVDAATVQVAIARHGKLDARMLPPGVYVGASPIGPDGWPWRILSTLFFPKHGYLLIVPPLEGDRYPEAVEATASLRRDFRSGGDGDALFARVEPFRPGSFDFPRPGEPVHELHRLDVLPAGAGAIRARVETAAAQIRRRGREYRLFDHNSNSALACFMQAAGFTEAQLRPLRRPAVRLRLPGLANARVCALS
jgi:hypothetical protein